jgi:ParB-like chromosome segregation protein Spo0J
VSAASALDSLAGKIFMEKLPTAQPGLRDLVVEHSSLAALKPHANNPRHHTKKQIRQIAASIETFGWTNPILVDAEDRIVAGHGRVEAAKLLNISTVPILRIEDLSDAQIRAYVIADNRLAELAGWDEEILTKELELLTDPDLNIDIEVTGFETGEIDVLIERLGGDAQPHPADDLPEVDGANPPTSLLGDVWLLGPHRLLCGDAPP